MSGLSLAERIAVAVAKLRLEGVHPSWIEHVKAIDRGRAAFIEQFCSEIEAQSPDSSMRKYWEADRFTPL